MAPKDSGVVFVLVLALVQGGVTMTSRVTLFQVTFGDDGRLRMEEFDKKTPCGYEESVTTDDKQDENSSYGPTSTTTTATTTATITAAAGAEEWGHGSIHVPTMAFNDIPQSPCVIYQTTSSDTYVILINGLAVSYPVRLDFTLKNPKSNLIEVRFMIGNSEVYVVEFRRGDGINFEDKSASLDLQFDEFHRFWVTYKNGVVKVGLHGTDSPLVQNSDPGYLTNEMDGIELYSKTKTPTQWNCYEPCTFSS